MRRRLPAQGVRFLDPITTKVGQGKLARTMVGLPRLRVLMSFVDHPILSMAQALSCSIAEALKMDTDLHERRPKTWYLSKIDRHPTR